MYFVHGFVAPLGPWTLATTDYGGEFSALVRERNFLGAQFHPERSARARRATARQFHERAPDASDPGHRPAWRPLRTPVPGTLRCRDRLCDEPGRNRCDVSGARRVLPARRRSRRCTRRVASQPCEPCRRWRTPDAGVSIQVGGGVRSRADAAELLDARRAEGRRWQRCRDASGRSRRLARRIRCRPYRPGLRRAPRCRMAYRA